MNQQNVNKNACLKRQITTEKAFQNYDINCKYIFPGAILRLIIIWFYFVIVFLFQDIKAQQSNNFLSDHPNAIIKDGPEGFGNELRHNCRDVSPYFN